MKEKKRIYSFDIFDTLITRVTYEPKGIFELMQKKLQKIDSIDIELKESFVMLRMIAEKNLRHQSKNEEIDIFEIYKYLIEMIHLEKSWIEFLVELEIETECRYTIGIKENIESLKKRKEEGNQVILISDMYLKEEHIRKMLVLVDDIFEDIPIYVSSEYGKTKSSGRLFLEVKKKENIEFSTWTHYGDNYHSDYLVPRMFGIDAVHIEKKSLVEWEKRLFNQKKEFDIDTQIELGIVSLIRLNNHITKYENLGLSIGGMILFPYVNWIIFQCQKRKIKRLYFIARDGYILKKIADKILETQNLDIETKYIYGSRKVWRESDGSGYVEDYLLQEIDISDNSYAFVDLLGTGATLKNVYNILHKNQSNLIMQIFYYSMFNQTCSENIRYIIYHTVENCLLLECICRAPHGLTIGYKKNGFKIEPILQDVNEELFRDCGIVDYIQGVEKFTEQILFYLDCIETPYFGKKNADILLEYICKAPDKDILEFICGLPHSYTDDDINQVFAPKLSYSDIFRIFACKGDVSKYYKGSELEYSILNLDRKKQDWLKFCERLSKSFLGRWLSYKEYVSGSSKLCLSENYKVIVYGAGKVGKKLYNELRYLHVDIIAWVDINYEELQRKSMPVQSVLSALDKSYDYIIIALAFSKSTENVKCFLEELGICQEKIITVNEFKERFIQNREKKQ